MKVLFVNSVCGYGSTGKIVERLAREVEISGGESLVCFRERSHRYHSHGCVEGSFAFVGRIIGLWYSSYFKGIW